MSEPCRHEREVEREKVRVELARLQRDYETYRRVVVTAERDAALATIERVRALCDEHDRVGFVTVEVVIAALGAPTTNLLPIAPRLVVGAPCSESYGYVRCQGCDDPHCMAKS